MNKLQKIGITILTISLLVLLYQTFLISDYKLYVISKNLGYKSHTIVKKNGIDIGKITRINYVNDTTILLELKIKANEKIPVNSRQKYAESIFGDGIFNFDHYSNEKSNYFLPNDTISSFDIIINNQDTIYRVIKNGIENLNIKFDSILNDTMIKK